MEAGTIRNGNGNGNGAPHGILFAVVVVLIIGAQHLLGDGAEFLTEAVAELLSPAGLLILPVTLLLLIRFLSSDRAHFLSDAFSFGGPDSIHRLGGSPVGVALFLVLLLVLLYSKVSIFGGEDVSGD